MKLNTEITKGKWKLPNERLSNCRYSGPIVRIRRRVNPFTASMNHERISFNNEFLGGVLVN